MVMRGKREMWTEILKSVNRQGDRHRQRKTGTEDWHDRSSIIPFIVNVRRMHNIKSISWKPTKPENQTEEKVGKIAG